MSKTETTKEHLIVYRITLDCRSMEGNTIRENFSVNGKDYQEALRKAVDHVDVRNN